MKHKTNYWYAAAAFFCTVTVLLSLLPSAVFADYPSQEEGEEIVEEVPSNSSLFAQLPEQRLVHRSDRVS